MATTASVIRVTPKMAAEWLTRNEHNRKIQDAVVQRYAEAMIAGEWRVNGETIKIGKSGRLLDGQYRLSAIVRCGLAIPLMVAHDVDDDVFDTIDTGRPRGGADVMSILGYKNSAALASAARWGILIERGGDFGRKIVPHEIRDYVENHKNLPHWVDQYAGSGQIRKIIGSGAMAAFSIAETIHGRETVTDFFEKLSTGIGVGKGNPAYELRERLISSRGSRSSTMLRTIAMVAITIKALNAWLEGRKVAVLRFGMDEEFPKILGME